MSTTKQARICLVTEELSFGRGAGGIGGAFHELALALTNAGHLVDVVYLPLDVDTKPSGSLLSYYYDHGISIVDPLIEQFVWAPFSYEKRSYGLFRHLVGSQQTYDFIHFHDYKGLGFASLVAKSQRLGFSKTKLVVQAHGPTRWALAANQHPFTHEDQLKIDFMERQSIARADVLVSPSRYMIDWFKQNGWALPAPNQIQVIQNVSLHLATLPNSERADSRNVPCREIILFGRHEERKGIVPFCDALDLVRNDLAMEDVTVTFLGRFGVINGWASPLYLVNRSRKWEFPIQFLPDLDRISACRYIANRKRGVVIVPSSSENSPYTVLESALAGRPLITSIDGGASELLESRLRPILTCKIDRGSLAAKLMEAVQKGLPPAHLAIPPNETVRLWLDLHATTASQEIKLEIKKQRSDPIPSSTPKVVAAITHHERPGKLYDALMSLVAQTYSNLEIVVVDDGSKSSEALHLLTRLAPLMTKLKVRLLRQENRYLGAARNHAAAHSDSEYILFLDDDDLAFPNLVQTLVTAAEATSADVVNCLNLYMPETRRQEAHPFPDQFSQKVSYVPIGGPLAMAPFENCYGAATALIRRSSLQAVGYYSEQYGVGHEDFELYVRVLQAGLAIEVCPLPLYLYEVDHDSMVSSTSPLRNWARVSNAIEISAQPREWRDVASVIAGQRAQANAENFFQYKVGTSIHKILLEQLAHEPQHTVRYAELLAEYASSTGTIPAVQAARALATARMGDMDGKVRLSMPPPSRSDMQLRDRELSIGGLTLEVLIDLSFGRVPEAIAALASLLNRGVGIPAQGYWRLLTEFTNCTGLEPEQAARVLSLFRLKALDQNGFEQIIPAMIYLALRSQDLHVAMELVNRAMIVDEQSYLAANPDVADAVVTARFSSALDHFTRAGQEEGRSGFETLAKVKDTLQAHLGVEVPITSLRQFIMYRQNEENTGALPHDAERRTASPLSPRDAKTIRAPRKAATNGAARATHP